MELLGLVILCSVGGVALWLLFGDAYPVTGGEPPSGKADAQDNPAQTDTGNGEIGICEAKSAIRKALGVDDELNAQEAAERRAALRNEVGQWYDLAGVEDEEAPDETA